MPSLEPPKDRLCWGLVTRRERWGLSWQGWLAAIATGVVVLLGSGLTLYPFLAVTHRAEGTALVVEGWVPDYIMCEGAAEFSTGRYNQVFTTGGPREGSVSDMSDNDTTALWSAERLAKAGVARELIQRVPSPIADRDRTYYSAVALRDWFTHHHISVQGINIVTEDVHARRTRLLFQKALGDDIKVGIIAVPNPAYDLKHWWRYSYGVREVIDETIAYLYARILFFPGK